jgi:hypothetical protein
MSVDARALPDNASAVPGSVNHSLYSGTSGTNGDAKGSPSVYVASVDDFDGSVHSLETIDGSAEVTTLVLPLRHGQAVSENLDALGVGITTHERSLYADAFIFLRPWPGPLDDFEHAGLETKAPAVHVGPVSLALRKPIEIRYALNGMVDGREAVYSLDLRKKRWLYESSEVRGDSVFATVRSPGVYAVLVDNEPPRIATARLGDRRSHATKDVHREIVVGIEDGGSGVDHERTEVYLNGEKQITRWDGFSKKMFVRLANENIIGAGEVSVVAVDQVGNTSKRTTTLNVNEQTR